MQKRKEADSMFVEYTNAMQLAQAVARELKYTHRTWNRFDPKNNEWWVLKSKDWPCYKHGKFLFKKRGDFLQCGLYVEKGIGLVGKGIIPKKFLMNNTWQWHQFLNDLEIGKVDSVLSELEASKYGVINVYVGSSYGNEPAFEPSTGRTDSIDFTWQNGTLRKERYMQLFGTVEKFQSVISLHELVREIKETKDIEWLWLDVAITVELEVKGVNEFNNRPTILTENSIIDKILMPFSPWVDGVPK